MRKKWERKHEIMVSEERKNEIMVVRKKWKRKHEIMMSDEETRQNRRSKKKKEGI